MLHGLCHFLASVLLPSFHLNILYNEIIANGQVRRQRTLGMQTLFGLGEKHINSVIIHKGFGSVSMGQDLLWFPLHSR
uniref:Uncharacterized protein n=1 Tax=Anguilla anguilla TaxID=7936 RepID=A0A0E9VXM7_ANGAN